MGKPYWGYSDKVTDENTTITARAEDSTYPADNLNRRDLRPYRSAGKCLDLDGSSEEAHMGSDHADFDITGDLTIEAVVCPATADTSSSYDYIVSKYVASAGNRSYGLTQYDDQFRLLLSDDGSNVCICQPTDFTLSASTHYRVKPIYDASDQAVTWRINGTAYGNTVVSGSIPASLHNSGTVIYIGADGAGANFWAGKIASAGIDNAEHDNGGWLDPSGCVAYWEFNDDLTDSSPNSHTLTGVGISDTDYENCTAYQWIGLTLNSTQNPTLLVLDRRHNLTSSATVRLLRDDWFSTFDSVSNITSVTAGQPVVSRISSTTETAWWLEIHDPSNSDGYIEIPHVYLGTYASMERAHLSGYGWDEPTPGSAIANSLGGVTGYVRGAQGWSKELSIRCNATDLATMQAVRDVTRLYRPVIFCEDVDNEDTQTYLVELSNWKLQHRIGPNHMVNVNVLEVPEGL